MKLTSYDVDYTRTDGCPAPGLTFSTYTLADSPESAERNVLHRLRVECPHAEWATSNARRVSL